ncbi:exonuclease subunit SbcD [Endozoicomonas sp. SM1973]|uniref:Nuclease SbcCD subunit D n=1 Tax=Spartinivicinus marinus TaxID=2994442 RepID=A0A853ID41_9GAMM|nr:exonuclease subunit SbcD [Spartinivicinus marinus]MCX4027266.1 exonuclease subunit SbcD [Spartinivicinus marinus]NYZ67974.1 exonuclease subunit SbcD [Spartinivicinus marinus]
MRLLHTSDWHLGQHFMNKSREAEHQAFLEWLLTTINEQKIDILVVAGDIFDTGTPPSYARKLYNNLMVGIQNTHCQQVLIVGGNHDSVAVLHESRRILSCLNITVIGGISDNLEEQVLTIKDSNSQPIAIICAVPYIRPRDVLNSQAGQTQTEKQQTLEQAIADHYQQLFDIAQQKAKNSNQAQPLPIIMTGHLATVGSQSSESVRDIYIGSLSAFPARHFPPADYIALGHLHSSQQVSGVDHIRYSGSPIPLSFDEVDDAKQVLCAELTSNGLASVESIEVPRFQSMATVKGNLADIEQQLGQLESTPGQSTWLEIIIQEDDYLSDLQSRLQQLIADTPFEILKLKRARSQQQTIEREAKETLTDLSPIDVFQRRLAQETMNDSLKNQLTLHFKTILSEIKEDETQSTTSISCKEKASL